MIDLVTVIAAAAIFIVGLFLGVFLILVLGSLGDNEP